MDIASTIPSTMAPPVRRSSRVRSSTRSHAPALTPDDSDYEQEPSQPKSTKRRSQRTSKRSAMSPIFGDGSSHRGKNVVRHDQLRRFAACTLCRRRRTKCDAAKPSCSACVRHSNYLKRIRKGAGEEQEDCACVYDCGDEDEASAPEVSQPSARSGGNSPARRLSQASEAEVIVTPALEPSAGMLAQMQMMGGVASSTENRVKENTRPTLPAYPSFPNQESPTTHLTPLVTNQTYSTSPYRPLHTLASLEGPFPIAARLPPALGPPAAPYAPYPDAHASFPIVPAQAYPGPAYTDSLGSNLSSTWPTWLANAPLVSGPLPFLHRHSVPDYAYRQGPGASLPFDPDAWWHPGQKPSFAETNASGPPSRDDYLPLAGMQQDSYTQAASDLLGKPTTNEIEVDIGQGWSGILDAGVGWRDQELGERMLAVGTAPGPLSPDQLFTMMQLLGS